MPGQMRGPPDQGQKPKGGGKNSSWTEDELIQRCGWNDWGFGKIVGFVWEAWMFRDNSKLAGKLMVCVEESKVDEGDRVKEEAKDGVRSGWGSKETLEKRRDVLLDATTRGLLGTGP